MKEKIISFKVMLDDNGQTCITFDETKFRTKKMISFDKGIPFADISLFHDLAQDLLYSDQDKRNLKPLIDQIFFADVNAVADRGLLETATTVRDLAGMIYSHFIPSSSKCDQ